MPYVTQPARIGFADSLAEIRHDIARACTAGDLNYLFTQIAIAYLQSYGTKVEYYQQHALYLVDNPPVSTFMQL